MSRTTYTRQDIRELLATDLDTLLTNVQAVYAYQKSDFAQLSPIVRVMSDGTLLRELTFTHFQTTYYYTVQIWVVRYSVQYGWSEEEAEALIDTISNTIMGYLDSDMDSKPWTSIDLVDRSTISVGGNEVAGEQFLVEDIPLMVTLDTIES